MRCYVQLGQQHQDLGMSFHFMKKIAGLFKGGIEAIAPLKGLRLDKLPYITDASSSTARYRFRGVCNTVNVELVLFCDSAPLK